MAIPADSDSTLPPWAVGWLIWVILGLLSLVTAALGWLTKRHIDKVDGHEKTLAAIPATYATKQMVSVMEEKIPGLVTRADFLSYMRQMKEDSDDERKEDREEQLRMHNENINNGAETRKAITNLGTETRLSVGAVHARVDALFTHGPGR